MKSFYAIYMTKMSTQIIKRIDIQNKIYKVAIFREDANSEVFDFDSAEEANKFYDKYLKKENMIMQS